MIMIKDEWYDIKDLDDVVKLVKDEFNYDLANRIEELVNEKEEQIKELEDDVEYWSSQVVGEE